MRALSQLMLISIILSLWGGAIPALAQDEGDRPALLLSDAVEVVFPAAVVFHVELALAAPAVNGVWLRLAQADRVLFEGMVEAQVLEETTNRSRLYFDWPLPSAEAPPLFTEIAYEWRIQVEDAEDQAEQGVFVFQPGSGEWRFSGTAPLRFAVVDSALNLRAARQAVLPAYELLAQHTGLEPDLQWVVLAHDFTFCSELAGDGEEVRTVIAPVDYPDLTYPCTEADAVGRLEAQGYTILRREGAGLLAFEQDLSQALFAAFYAEFWEEQPVPAWFKAGLQHYYAVNSEPLLLRQVQAAARTARLYTPEQLQRGPLPADDANLWRAQSAALVLFIADRHGASVPFQLAQAVPERGFEAAFVALINQSWDFFLVEWERWLFTESAASMARWRVYQPTTVTLPPTAISTRSFSVTMQTTSLAPTARAFRPTDTALPRPTASPQPEREPAVTNTPRPPGSLETPQPAEAEAAAGGGNGLCGAGLPAMLIPGVALVYGGFRRKQA